MTDEELKARFDSLRIQGTKTNKKRTEEDLRARFDYLQSQAQQPVEQTQPQPTQPTYANHGALAQQGHQNVAQRQANIAATITKPMTEYMQNGGSININDTASLAQLARERGIPENEINYLRGRQQASTLPSMQTQYKPLPGSTTPVSIPNSGYDPAKSYDIKYGNEEAQKVLGNVKMNSDDRSASTYVDAKANLEKAQREGNLREIAKNQGIIRNYENIYKSNYNKEWDKLKGANIKSLNEHVQGAASDLNKSYEKLLTSTGDNLKRAFDEYQRDLQRYNEAKSRYDEAITYDELINNNPIKDFGRGLGVGATGAVAKGMTYGKLAEDALLEFFGSARNPANINANSLLDYNNENYQVEKYSGAIERTAGDTDVTGEYQNMSPASAFNRLKQLADNNPEYRGLQTLLREISTHSYKGTAEDLAKELDRISREMYQGWKNTHTQAGFDWEEALQTHNERAYGDNPALKNIVNSSITVGEMFPSMVAGTVGQPASMAALFMSAAGGAADQAINEGATINQGTLYGALSGATEVGTEMIGGDNVNRALGLKGQSLLSKVFGNSLKNMHIESKAAKVALKYIFDVAGEMTEEGISAAIEPFIKTLVYDPNAMPDNVGEYFKDIMDAAVEAIPSTVIMSGIGAGGKVLQVNRAESALIKKINEDTRLTQATKIALIDEVKKAAQDVKLGLTEETGNYKYDIMQNMNMDKAASKVAKDYEAYNLKQSGKEDPNSVTVKAAEIEKQGFKVPQETTNLLQYIQDTRGTNIVFDPTIDGNGVYDESTRTIYLNPKSERAVEFTLAHELAHDLKAGNAADYLSLQKSVLDYAKKLENYDESRAALDATYKAKLGEGKYNIDDEVTNDILGQVLGNQDFLNTLAQENPNVFQRLWNWIKNVLLDGSKSGLTLEQRRMLNKYEQGFKKAYNSAFNGTNTTQANASSLSEESPFRESEPTIYTRNKDSLKRLSELLGRGMMELDANIGETVSDVKTNLSREDKFIANYAKEKGIPIQKNKRIINYSFLHKPEAKQFVRDNNLDVKKVANDPKLLEQFLDIIMGTGDNSNINTSALDQAKQTWRNLYEHVRDTGDIPSPLKRVDREMQYAREGLTELEEDGISREQSYEIYKSKEFQDYLDNFVKDIFDKHNYTTDEVMEEAKENHGTTDDYNLGAYMTTDGELLKFDYGGYRDDHRNIKAFGMGMQDFMDYGAIRMQPEGNGFEIAVEPTEAQYERLADYIDNFLKRSDGDIYVDIDTAKGHDDIGKQYSPDTPTDKIINDIRTYFRTGKYPESRYTFSKSNPSWQGFLEKNFNWSKGKKTKFETLPSKEELQKQEQKKQKKATQIVANEPIAKMSADKSLDDLRDFKEVGNKKVHAYQYDNPEVKPFFQHEAQGMLNDLDNAIKGERSATWDDYGELHYTGVTRETTKDIADLLDGNNGIKLSYDDIRKGLEAIIKDNGAENIAAAKRVEMAIDKRLREGYTDSYGTEYEPNENYQNFLEGKDYIDPAEYERQLADKMIAEENERYEQPKEEDTTLFSLSEEEQKEVNDYADKLFEDKTLDEKYVTDVYDRLKRVQNYADFENIKQEVSDYKDKMYKGISGLEDIANLKPEDTKQREMTYKQRKDKNTTNQRKFFENVETSPIIAEQTKNNANVTTYERQGNIETLNEMRDKLDERGNDLVEEWKVKTKNFTAKDVALGAVLIERYQQDGDWASAARTVEKLADMGTEAGRAVQMYSIFQRLSPETMAIYQQKALDQAFEDMKKKKTGKWVEANKDKFKLTAEDTQFIYEQVEKASQAIDEETKQRELSKIENRINEKLPPEAGQSVKALRRIAMLFNPKTQVRNIVGNALIMPVNDVADFVGSLIDKLVSRWSKIRTTSSPNLITKAKGFKKGIRDAITDYKTGTRTTATGSKYEFDIGAKPFNENTGSKVRNALNRKLNGINDLLSAVMSGGDRPFYEAAYKNSLEGQMKANNVSEPTPEMVDIAVNEALQRTWNDDNEYTNFVLGLRRGMNKINVHGFGFGDLIIPFAKTPANLTKAIVEYSPAGFIKSVIDFNDMRKAISRGELTPMQQKKFVSSMSKAIAGTILYTIAGTLARTGAITGSADDDKDVKNFEQNVLGIQPYSVRLGDKTFTYSWANPINAPLAIMADQYKMEKENAKLADRLYDYFKVAGNVLLENSFLQGVQELFGNQDGIMGGIIESIESMPEQLIPTFMSQIASLGDDTQRQTFEYKDEAKTVANRLKNKIPGARNTLEAQVNTFGEEIENQNNVFNAFLNPANVKEAKITDEQKALYDVYQETKDKTIFPMQAPYYVANDFGENQNLSSKDRYDYQKASGQFVADVYEDLFKNDRFNKASNEEKVAILHEIATDGNAKGKEAVGASKTVTNSNLSRLNERNELLEEANIPLADYYIAWYAKNHKPQGSTYDAKQKAIRDYTDLTPEQEDVLFGIFNIEHKKGSK